MLALEQAASAYEQATDGCRPSLVGTRNNARQWQRVKPDEESHVLSELDFEEGATWDDLVLTTPELVRRTDSIGIQSPALYGPPIGKNRAAAM
jgi:hypothetical protein